MPPPKKRLLYINGSSSSRVNLACLPGPRLYPCVDHQFSHWSRCKCSRLARWMIGRPFAMAGSPGRVSGSGWWLLSISIAWWIGQTGTALPLLIR
jgi:hypothetical protein